MLKKQDKTKKENIKIDKKDKKDVEVLLKSKFNISWQMYQKWVHLLTKEDVDYLKNSPFKKDVEIL